MTNYVKTTNFLRKDSLPDSDNDKIIRGSEFDTEFNNLVTAIASKSNLISPEFSGVPRAPTADPCTNSSQIATTAFVTQNAILKGMIVMWSGLVETIPTGYALCDGTNDTPDLRDRFVVGASSTYAVDATGGSKDAVAVSHSHTFSSTTSASGSHSHKLLANVAVTDTGPFGSNDQVAKNSAGGLGNGDYVLCKTPTGATIGNSSTVGNHTHSLSGSTSSVGSSGTNKNLPPYYALAFIMKT